MSGRYLQITTVFSCLIVILHQILANTCDQVKLHPNDLGFENDKAVVGFMFFKIREQNVFMCAKQCLYKRRCESFDYDVMGKWCSLNNVSSIQQTLQQQDGTVHGDVAGIPQVSLSQIHTKLANTEINHPSKFV